MNHKDWIEENTLKEIEPLPSDSDAIAHGFNRHLRYHLGHFMGFVPYYLYEAMAFTVRDRIMSRWHHTWQKYNQHNQRKAYYISLEFLIGRYLGNHLLNLDIEQPTHQALQELAVELEDIIDEEPDAGLGNGGLGRLAACFLDSCASLDLPVIGYGLRYEYGMFRQHLDNGYQVEEPEHWLRDGNPWEVIRREYQQTIHFGGRTEHFTDPEGRERARWIETDDVIAVPHDLPISGYRNDTVNTLRLWRATATEVFSLSDFNAGSYTEDVEAKIIAEHITMVLYPNDASESGKELRLKQQYFLASASIKDVLRQWERTNGKDYSRFAEFNVFQMNDTHPAISVAELMRILIDDKHLSWSEAWKITRSTMAYTNHTLLPEALETWPVDMMQRLIPRLMEIIFLINQHFLEEVSMKWPGENERQARMSIIEHSNRMLVRMANLAIVGSFSVNGVAALHSKLLCEGLFKDFYELWPQRFNNKTNGVTPRRWIAHANPGLRQLIDGAIGSDWISDLSNISAIEKFALEGDRSFLDAWDAVKRNNKQHLAGLIKASCGVDFSVDAMFDVQVKRIHEYKRQLLNILHVIHCYIRIKHNGDPGCIKRAVLIGGKAAPGYYMAKKIIKLVNNVAHVVNDDPQLEGRLKVAFLPDYNVSKMEMICAAADLSEQISTAGKEASGTGNMKLMMNGAVTIGTYDGANIEILKAVGDDNFFLFGLRANEAVELRGHYDPQAQIDSDPELQAVMQLLESGHFNLFEPGIFDDVINSLKNPHDPWLTLADFRSYVDAQNAAAEKYCDRDTWLRMSILNTARSGYFSTDRTISEYNRDIWKL